MGGYFQIVDGHLVGDWGRRYRIVSANAKRGIYVIKVPRSRSNHSGIRGMPHYVTEPAKFVVLEKKEEKDDFVRLEEVTTWPVRS